MKKIFTSLFLTVFMLGAIAQDLTFNQVASDDYLVKGLSYTSFISMTNQGPDPFPQDSTITLGITVDNDVAVANNVSFQSAFPVGANSNFINLAIPAAYTDTMSTTADSVEICLIIVSTPDTVQGNNVLCFNAAWEDAPSIDIGGSNVEAYAAGQAVGTTLTLGSLPTIDSIRLSLRNYGPTAFPLGAQVNYNVSLGTSSTNTVGGTLTSSNFMQDSTTTRVLTNPTLLSALTWPTAAGTTELCVNAQQDGDTDASNDSFCATLTLEEEQDPNNIVDLQNSNGLKAFFVEDILNLHVNTNITGASSLQVINISGQEVLNTVINTQGSNALETFSLSTDNLNSGVYFVKLNNEVIKVVK